MTAVPGWFAAAYEAALRVEIRREVERQIEEWGGWDGFIAEARRRAASGGLRALMESKMDEDPALSALARIRELVLRCAAQNQDPTEAELTSALADGFEVLRAIVIGLTRPLVAA